MAAPEQTACFLQDSFANNPFERISNKINKKKHTKIKIKNKNLKKENKKTKQPEHLEESHKMAAPPPPLSLPPCLPLCQEEEEAEEKEIKEMNGAVVSCCYSVSNVIEPAVSERTQRREYEHLSPTGSNTSRCRRFVSIVLHPFGWQTKAILIAYKLLLFLST